MYITQNDLDLLPGDLAGFPAFCAQRKEWLEQRLDKLLGAPASPKEQASETQIEPRSP